MSEEWVARGGQMTGRHASGGGKVAAVVETGYICFALINHSAACFITPARRHATRRRRLSCIHFPLCVPFSGCNVKNLFFNGVMIFQLSRHKQR